MSEGFNSIYRSINDRVRKRVSKLIDNGYEQAALGTLDKSNFPFVSKIIPMFFEGDIYLLLSDLSEHTRNIGCNPVVSIYYAKQEEHKTKSNNPRLTLQGKLVKLQLAKEGVEFKLLIEKYNQIDFGSDLWAYFDDFNFYKFEEKRKLYVEGFAQAYEESV